MHLGSLESTQEARGALSYRLEQLLRPRQTRTHCCGHIVAHDVSWAAQTGKHLLRTQNVSEQNQKHFLCLGHKICVRNKCCARGQTGKHLCRQQCVLVCQGLYATFVLCKLPACFHKGPGKRGHIVVDTLLWTHCCGHIVVDTLLWTHCCS